MTRLAIIHTTPATVDSMKILAGEILPDCEVINFVDDSILPQLIQNGGSLADVEERMVAYARFAEQAGADLVLEACSSVGELVEKMQAAVSIPIVRVDEAMAEVAVRRGQRIGVAATLPTTLGATRRLLEQKASLIGKSIQLEEMLIQSAFEKLSVGDRAGHDALLLEGLGRLADRVDVVVLAQASMARVVPQLPVEVQPRFLSSPRSAMEQVKFIIRDL